MRPEKIKRVMASIDKLFEGEVNEDFPSLRTLIEAAIKKRYYTLALKASDLACFSAAMHVVSGDTLRDSQKRAIKLRTELFERCPTFDGVLAIKAAKDGVHKNDS